MAVEAGEVVIELADYRVPPPGGGVCRPVISAGRVGEKATDGTVGAPKCAGFQRWKQGAVAGLSDVLKLWTGTTGRGHGQFPSQQATPAPDLGMQQGARGKGQREKGKGAENSGDTMPHQVSIYRAEGRYRFLEGQLTM